MTQKDFRTEQNRGALRHPTYCPINSGNADWNPITSEEGIDMLLELYTLSEADRVKLAAMLPPKVQTNDRFNDLDVGSNDDE